MAFSDNYWVSGSVLWGQGNIGYENFLDSQSLLVDYSFLYSYSKGKPTYNEILLRHNFFRMFKFDYYYGIFFIDEGEMFTEGIEYYPHIGIVLHVDKEKYSAKIENRLGYFFNRMYEDETGSDFEYMLSYQIMMGNNFIERKYFTPFVRVENFFTVASEDLIYSNKNRIYLGVSLIFEHHGFSAYYIPYNSGSMSGSWDDNNRLGVSASYKF